MLEKAIIAKARQANLPEYLMAKGYTLKSEGRQYRVKDISGLLVAQNYWYNHIQQRGGNSLDYVIQVEGKSFKEAIAELQHYSSEVCRDTLIQDNHKLFRPPPKNNDCSRVITYLVKTRGIRYDVLHPHIVNERIYQARGSNNCVFTGLDCDTHEVRYAFQRSSNPNSNIMFETRGSDKRYSFSLHGTTKTLLVFEAVIDLFSYMSMEPGAIYKDAFWLSLGGLSNAALDRFVFKWRTLEDIIFCLDSDVAADETYKKLGVLYTSFGFNVLRQKPVYKDWNEQLLHGGYSFPAPPLQWEAIP